MSLPPNRFKRSSSEQSELDLLRKPSFILSCVYNPAKPTDLPVSCCSAQINSHIPGLQSFTHTHWLTFYPENLCEFLPRWVHSACAIHWCANSNEIFRDNSRLFLSSPNTVVISQSPAAVHAGRDGCAESLRKTQFHGQRIQFSACVFKLPRVANRNPCMHFHHAQCFQYPRKPRHCFLKFHGAKSQCSYEECFSRCLESPAGKIVLSSAGEPSELVSFPLVESSTRQNKGMTSRICPWICTQTPQTSKITLKGSFKANA